MSDEALIAELERQREFARYCFAYDEALGRGLPLPRPGPNLLEIARPVTDILATHPVFGQGREIFFAQKVLYLHPWYVSRVLLRVMLGTDAPSAVAWLHRLFSIDSADLRMVAVVHGLDVK